MTGKENLSSAATGVPPSHHKFPSNKAASSQVTHMTFSTQVAEGQAFANATKRLLYLKAFSQLYHSTAVFSKKDWILDNKVNSTKVQNSKGFG